MHLDHLSATAGIDNQLFSTSSNLRAGSYTQTVSAISGADALNYSFTPFTTGIGNLRGQSAGAERNRHCRSHHHLWNNGCCRSRDLLEQLRADDLSATAAIDNQLFSTSSNLRAGSYTQTVSAISGADALNYSFTPFTTGSATYVVNPLALSGTAIAGVTTTYGTAAAAGAVTFSNNFAADDLSATAGIDNQLFSTSSNLRAGTYTQTVSAIAGADALNYSFTPFTTGSATYVVNPLALSGTAIAGVTTTYGTTAAAGAVTFSNLCT